MAKNSHAYYRAVENMINASSHKDELTGALQNLRMFRECGLSIVTLSSPVDAKCDSIIEPIRRADEKKEQAPRPQYEVDFSTLEMANSSKVWKYSNLGHHILISHRR